MEIVRRYSRTIADLFPNRGTLSLRNVKSLFLNRSHFSDVGGALFLYFGVMVLVLSLFLLLLYMFFMRVSYEHARVEQEYFYWQEQVDLYPQSPDAHYNAAYFAARVGKKHQAVSYVERALYLDGDFDRAWVLRSEILQL